MRADRILAMILSAWHSPPRDKVLVIKPEEKERIKRTLDEGRLIDITGMSREDARAILLGNKR